jgi:hypothetical protein
VSGDEEDRNLARNELFVGLSILACANGLGSRVIQAINRAGWTDAALGTFEISAIVFTACAAGVWLILRDSTDKIRSADLVVAAELLLLIILPTSFFVE